MKKLFGNLCLLLFAIAAVSCQSNSSQDATPVEKGKSDCRLKRIVMESTDKNFPSCTVTYVWKDGCLDQYIYQMKDSVSKDVFSFTNQRYCVNGKYYQSNFSNGKLKSVFWIEEGSTDGTDFGCTFAYDADGRVTSYQDGVESHSTISWNDSILKDIKVSEDGELSASYVFNYVDENMKSSDPTRFANADYSNPFPFDVALMLFSGYEYWMVGITGRVSSQLPVECVMGGKKYPISYAFDKDSKKPVELIFDGRKLFFEWE